MYLIYIVIIFNILRVYPSSSLIPHDRECTDQPNYFAYSLHTFRNGVFLLLFQNGYPARRRSLVDDARFETLMVKQTKQCVLEEARQRSNGNPPLS